MYKGIKLVSKYQILVITHTKIFSEHYAMTINKNY